MHTFFLSVLLPLAAGGHLMHVYRIQHSAPDGFQWTREHADDIATRLHGATYTALMVSETDPGRA